LARATAVTTLQIGTLLDDSVILRAQTRKLLDESVRLDELRRTYEASVPLALADFGELVDGEICEDTALICQLNALGHQCDRCGGDESVAAVVRFESMPNMLAICAECFQELTALSLGQVT